jgi:hypothetical protein
MKIVICFQPLFRFSPFLNRLDYLPVHGVKITDSISSVVTVFEPFIFFFVQKQEWSIVQVDDYIFFSFYFCYDYYNIKKPSTFDG